MIDDWIAIFRTGTHTDSQGREQTWTEADLEEIASSYDPARHEAPVVIGHPEADAPAWGWVENLKRGSGSGSGDREDTLYARLKNLVPEFVEMVRKGLFKKRSISLYPDFTLRHLGFLGAMPPAVKGLTDVTFKAEAKAIVIEFEEEQYSADERDVIDGRLAAMEKKYEVGQAEADADVEAKAEAKAPRQKEDSKMNFKEWFKGVFTKAIDEMPEDILDLKPVAQASLPAAVTFSEAEVEKIKAKAEAEAEARGKAKAVADFTEREKASRLAQRKAEIAAFCEAQCKAGKLTPAIVKAGLPDFMVGLSDETVLEFAEGETPNLERRTPYAWFKGLLQDSPQLITFGEHATREKNIDGQGDAAQKLEVLVKQKRDADKGLSYSEALRVVQMENIELAREALAEVRGGL